MSGYVIIGIEIMLFFCFIRFYSFNLIYSCIHLFVFPFFLLGWGGGVGEVTVFLLYYPYNY